MRLWERDRDLVTCIQHVTAGHAPLWMPSNLHPKAQNDPRQKKSQEFRLLQIQRFEHYKQHITVIKEHITAKNNISEQYVLQTVYFTRFA